jgi:DNA-binding response OmpR family regulator
MDEKTKILLCEDDENLGMLLREYLQAKGYATDLMPDGDAGYKAGRNDAEKRRVYVGSGNQTSQC